MISETHVRLRVVVASPSDVQSERDAVSQVVDDLNRGIAPERKLLIELSRWETDAHPGFHPEGPQGLIDKKLRIQDCDVLVGIFWHRFGTPSMDAGSGTEHEFRVAYDAWKQSQKPEIMVYFKQRPYKPRSREEIDQWGLVLDFQNHFPKEGLWWPYTSTAVFKDLFRKHLEGFIRDTVPLRASSGEAAPSEPPTGGGQSTYPLVVLQNAYLVPDGIIDEDYIDAIADEVFDHSQAVKVLAYVDTELKKLDAHVTAASRFAGSLRVSKKWITAATVR
jgi:hypothetical protein